MADMESAVARTWAVLVVGLVVAAALTAVPLAAAPDDTLALIESEEPPSNVELAVATARATFVRDDDTLERVDKVLISRDDEFADALASGVMQGDAPLLLVPSGGPVPTSVRDLIRDFGTTRATVLGGAAAVSAAVADELQQMGLTVDRRQGPSRFDTAVAIAAADAPDSDTVLLARAFSSNPDDPSQAFADSIAAGGMSARTGFPTLLTQTGQLSAATRDYLVRTPVIRNVRILGGEAAISRVVEDELRSLGLAVIRDAGATRAATAVAIAAAAGDPSALNAERVIVTQGAGADAWAGGFVLAAHAARFNAPIVLAAGPTIPPETEAFLADGIGGDPSSAPVMTCAVVPSVCEPARVAAQLPPSQPTPSPTPTQPAAELVNGGFETGDLQGWTVVNHPDGEGDWFLYSQGGVPPQSQVGTWPPPPEGVFAVSTDQPSPGSHVLYQEFTVPADSTAHLSFWVFYENHAGDFAAPPTLDFTTEEPNQQFRVDLMVAGSDPFSVAPEDVLAPLFQTVPRDPPKVEPTLLHFDVSAFAGQTVRLRFAEVDNVFFLQAGTDDVTLTVGRPPSNVGTS